MNKEIHLIDFPKKDNWLKNSLPVSPTVPSGWSGLERIMPALVKVFCRNTKNALEFGVEYGHSGTVLANLFDQVTGVDWFKGDEHSMWRDDYYETAKSNMEQCPNVTLIKSSYQDWLAQVPEHAYYDLVHVDVVHTYEATYTIGRWAADHAGVTIFHDTSYIWQDVPNAILKIAEETGKDFYNYPHCNGLGILY